MIAVELLVEPHNVPFLYSKLASNCLFSSFSNLDFEVKRCFVDQAVRCSNNQELAHVFNQRAIEYPISDVSVLPGVKKFLWLF